MENKLPLLVSEEVNEDLNTDWDDDEEHDDNGGGSGDKDNVCEHIG